MAANNANADLSAALLNSIRDGSYPESEEVITAELSASALSFALKAVQVARVELESEIRYLSRESAPNVDEWISQARQIFDDIAKSKALAREIVREYETGKTLAAKARDAGAKVDLLHEEVRFTGNLSSALEHIISVRGDVQTARNALAKGNYLESASRLESLQYRLHDLAGTNAKTVIKDEISELHTATHRNLEAALNTMIKFGESENQQWMKVESDYQGSSEHSLESLFEASALLGTLNLVTKSLSHNINRSIFLPLLSRVNSSAISAVIVGNQLEIPLVRYRKDVHNILDSVVTTVQYLQLMLPPTVRKHLGFSIIPDMISTLTAEWLNPTFPLELSEISELRKTQNRVQNLQTLISSDGWPGQQELLDWVEQSPKLWLTKRRMASLDGVRKAFATRRGPSRQVERIEREIISKHGEAFAVHGGVEDAFTDSQEDGNTSVHPEPLLRAEEEDYSGWDFEEQDGSRNGAAPSQTVLPDAEEEDSADAWGWGDESLDETRTNPSIAATGQPKAMSSNDDNPKGQEQEITLTETYTVTDIPDFILEIIYKDVRDAEEVKNPQYALLHSTSPSSGLLAVPALVLAMFRAVAPTCYASAVTSCNMHLYNDCSYIAEKLRELDNSSTAMKVTTDCNSLEKFAKSAYAREMDIQRTILGDLLDGAQGFSRCTQLPFSTECETAVSSTTDRIREVRGEWSSILSHSALLQSVGSLTATVIKKVIKDIEDLEDISETESQRLAAFCNQISKLEDLFTPERSQKGVIGAEGETVSLIAVYVSNWLRFQYLLNILESSLVDIKYLWTEGELSLEFSAEEVIDLIKALFAESHHRRTAIVEIRRSGK